MKKLLLGFGIALFALSLSAMAQTGGGPGAGCGKGACGKGNMTAQNNGRMRGRGMAAMQPGAGCQGQCPQNTTCRCGQCAAAKAATTQDQKK